MMPNETKNYFETIAKAAYSRPFDANIAQDYFAAYDRLTEPDIWDEIKYHKLKYLHEDQKVKNLNHLACLFLKIKKPSIARMCLLESLWRDMDQPEVFAQIKELDPYAQPIPYQAGTTVKNKISVLMTTYNRGRLIKESIESVLNQTFRDFELIIVNDGGSREVEEMIEAFASDKIRYFYYEPNRGQPAALNHAVRQATGEFIAYLDDDDIYYPHCLEALFAALRRSHHPLIYGKTIQLEGKIVDGHFHQLKTLKYYGEPFDKNIFLIRTLVTTCAVLHKKSMFEEFGLFNEDLYTTLDWEYWLRILSKYDFEYLDHLVAEYHIHGTNAVRLNAVSTAFFGALLPRYHYLQQGQLTLARYLSRHNRKQARRLFALIKNNLWNWPRSDFLISEFMKTALAVRDIPSIFKLTSDTFNFSGQKCARFLMQHRFFVPLAFLILLVPGKIVHKIFNGNKESS